MKICINICRKEGPRLRSLIVGLVLVLLVSDFSLYEKITMPYIELEKWNEVSVHSAETNLEIVESSKSVQENEIDWTDDNFAKGYYQSPIVIESHKLVFYQVAKVGSSVFKRLFRRMMGESDWLEASPHSNQVNGLKYIGDFPRDQQLEMLTSPNWTRAIFWLP